MAIRIESQIGDKRVPLRLEAHAIYSLCMDVSRAAPIFLIAEPRDEKEVDLLLTRIRRMGYWKVEIEVTKGIS